MNWVIIGTLSAVTFAVVNIFDKILLVRYIKDVRTFTVMVGVIQVPMGLAVLPFYPMESHSLQAYLAAYFSGFLWGGSLCAMFLALQKVDVSVVIPVVSTSPVFVALLAVGLLGEELTIYHWGAILITVSGAVLISSKPSRTSSITSLKKTFILLLLGTFCMAVAQVLTKVAADDMSVWNLFTLRNQGLASACVVLMFRPYMIGETIRVLSQKETAFVFFMAEGVLVFFSLLLTLWAISLAQVSLVVTVMSTRPLFVFFMSMVISLPFLHILDESLEWKTISTKVISTAMIVVGIVSISLL